MSETMLMTQALDERDLLVKKINDKIDKLKLVDVKRKNEEKTADSRVTPEEFTKVAQTMPDTAGLRTLFCFRGETIL